MPDTRFDITLDLKRYSSLSAQTRSQVDEWLVSEGLGFTFIYKLTVAQGEVIVVEYIGSPEGPEAKVVTDESGEPLITTNRYPIKTLPPIAAFIIEDE